jgi:REP element-mobilizing transposase RayT
MPRKLRVQYPGAIYHVMSRGDRRDNIFLNDVDRQDFLKTLAETCQKTGFEVHAYCLMPNHFHLVVETPEANLVSGMAWLLSTYTIRLNARHKLFGHVFGGRYKALVVDGSGNGYLKTVCDYVHLNPVRAGMIKAEERLVAYPWSSLIWYAAAPEHRPAWMRVDRLLGEHGIGADSSAGRQQFEQRMEWRRGAEEDEQALAPLRRGWCLGSEEFRRQILERMAGQLGDHHAGELRRQSGEVRAERILAEELQRLGWTEADLARQAGRPHCTFTRKNSEEPSPETCWLIALEIVAHGPWRAGADCSCPTPSQAMLTVPPLRTADSLGTSRNSSTPSELVNNRSPSTQYLLL